MTQDINFFGYELFVINNDGEHSTTSQKELHELTLDAESMCLSGCYVEIYETYTQGNKKLRGELVWASN